MPTTRMLPHGSYSLIPAVLTTMAWLASLFQDKCDFARVTGDIVATLSGADDTPFLEFGFAAYREPIFDGNTGKWHVVYTGKCLEYPEGSDIVDQDVSWNAAKICAFFASVLGGAGAFFLWFSTCCVFGRATWRLAGYEVLLAAIFQSLAFVWFTTDMCQDPGNDCSLFWGSKADILATCFFTLAALLIFCYYPVPKDPDEENEGLILEPRDASRPEVRMRYQEEQQVGSLSLATPAGRGTTASPSSRNESYTQAEEEDEEGETTMSSGENSRQEGDSDNKDMSDMEMI
jgi:hypothetical protein